MLFFVGVDALTTSSSTSVSTAPVAAPDPRSPESQPTADTQQVNILRRVLRRAYGVITTTIEHAIKLMIRLKT